MASPVRYYEQFYSERRAGSTLLHAPAMREQFDAQLPTAIGDSGWPTCIKRDGLDEGDVEA
jgi:hypothetical protein